MLAIMIVLFLFSYLFDDLVQLFKIVLICDRTIKTTIAKLNHFADSWQSAVVHLVKANVWAILIECTSSLSRLATLSAARRR